MDPRYQHLRKYFPSLSKKVLRKKYKVRITRLRILMRFGIPNDVRMMIDGKIRPSDFDQKDGLPSLGTSHSAMKRRARAIIVTCCKSKCISPGYVSENREDKINFCSFGLSEENLDDLYAALKNHPSGYVQGAIFKLWPKLQAERQRLKNMITQDPVFLMIRKLDEE